jgi:hypothetical protein
MTDEGKVAEGGLDSRLLICGIYDKQPVRSIIHMKYNANAIASSGPPLRVLIGFYNTLWVVQSCTRHLVLVVAHRMYLTAAQ